jgi:hypothetical protein
MTPCLFALVAVTQARGTDSRPEAAGELAKELKVAPEQARAEPAPSLAWRRAG